MHAIEPYIIQYGYLAIFLLVFLPGIGVPNPLATEFVLMLSGYLCFTHSLILYKVIIVAIVADFTSSCILYFIFYLFGKWLLNHKPGWLHIKTSTINKMERYVNKRGLWSLLIGRLTPFLRGYVPVGAGLLRIKPQPFVTIIILSTIVWIGGLVLLGHALAPYWNTVMKKMGMVENIIIVAILIIGSLIAGKYLIRAKLK